MTDTRTLTELAQESLDVQNACNLSGVVHSFAQAISRLREVQPNRGTEFYNRHPISLLFADKVASLTNLNSIGETLYGTYDKVKSLAKGKEPT